VPFVVTAEQSAGRPGPDRPAEALRALDDVAALVAFERTAADGVTGVLAEPVDVVDVVLRLVRSGGWCTGVGAGPLVPPETGRAPAGPAFLAARRAVDAAAQRPSRLAVRGVVPVEAGDAQAVLCALGTVVERRSAQAWEAISLVDAGRSQTDAARELGISRQAVGQRLAAGMWALERELRPAAARLLARAAG
jgi:hypothetical protein